MEAEAHVTASVAGVAIVHELSPGFSLGDGEGAASFVGPDAGARMTIRHRIGSIDTTGMLRRLEVGEQVEYLEDASGSVAIRLRPFDASIPQQLLRTVDAGREYEVSYEFLPTGPISRRDTEMSAYTLALSTRKRGILAHGCGFILPTGRAALCVGMSGAGKSTLGRMMRDQPGVRVLNDDRIVVTRDGGRFQAWSTPWPGRAGIARPGDAPLGVIGLIGRGPAMSATRIGGRAALTRLLRTIALPLWDAGEIGFGLELMDALIEEVPIVQLSYPLA